MTRRLLLFSLALLVAAAGAGFAFRISVPAPPSAITRPQPRRGADRIVVDPASPVRVIPADFFGMNVSAFWDPHPLSGASARALRQTPIKAIRFPGGVVADYYDWQDPYYKGWSSVSPAQAAAYARAIGATRLVFGTDYKDTIGRVPGRAYAVNSPANAAAWVAYNRAHHVPALMEVGNEEDGAVAHRADDPAFAPYLAAFDAQARAMHRADPGVRVAGPVGMNEYYWWALDSLGQFLAHAGNRSGSGQVDAISLHFYRGSTWYDARGNAQYWLSPQGPWAYIARMIRAHDTRALPVYITEWNAGAGDQNNAFNPTIGHGLVVADMLGAFALSGVAGEDYWELHGSSGWGMLSGSGDTKPADTPTPAYYAQALWGHMGRTLLQVRQDDDAATMTSAYATAGSHGGREVLVINKRGTARSVSIAFDGATARGQTLRTYTLVGTSKHHWDTESVYDGVVNPSAARPLPGPSVRTVPGETIEATIPPYGAAVFALDGTGPAARLATAALPHPAPASSTPPAVAVALQGGPSATRATAGDTVTLQASVRASEDIGPALLDFELYDATGAKAWQQTETVTVTAGQTIAASMPWALSGTTYGGTYALKIGLFTVGWGHTFAWDDKAGRIAVSGPPAPTVRVSGRVQGAGAATSRAGETLHLQARVSSAKNGLTGALVDFEIYSPSGAKVCQVAAPNVDVTRDGAVSVARDCSIPAGTPAGAYVLKIGVFKGDWSHLFVWNDHAAALTLTR